MRVFKRKIWERLAEWKRDFSRDYALLIEGARRVGKTTAVREFAAANYRSYILIDFSKDRESMKLFRDCMNDLDGLFLRLQSAYGTELYVRDSLIIMDEVQFCPQARQAIKHLVADGRYDYIETGSLISVKRNVRQILIPSEEMAVEMFPMDFEEYLWAKGDTVTAGLIRECFRKKQSLGQAAHRKIMGEYAEYMLVGGMPQAVDALLEYNSFSRVEKVKRGILDLYVKDAAKTEESGSLLASMTLQNVPSMLSKHEKRFMPSAVRRGSRIRDFRTSIAWLAGSKTVNICYRSTDPSPALGLNLDEDVFKLYMADTGLLFTAAFRANIGDADEICSAMLKGKLSINEGMFFENQAAQELKASGHDLVYGRFYAEGTSRVQEIDFILASAGRLIPIEVKSSVSGKHVSLDRFMEKYRKWVKEAYVIHTKDLRVDGNVVYIPIYMTMCL